MEENNLNRRNISGIYIFDTFPTDLRETPTCIEDCQQRTRRNWCATKTPEYLNKVVIILATKFKELCNDLCNYGDIKKFSKDCFVELIDLKVSKVRKNPRDLTDAIDYLSEKITSLADSCGIRNE